MFPKRYNIHACRCPHRPLGEAGGYMNHFPLATRRVINRPFCVYSIISINAIACAWIA
jgi:hypothetical protein